MSLEKDGYLVIWKSTSLSEDNAQGIEIRVNAIGDIFLVSLENGWEEMVGSYDDQIGITSRLCHGHYVFDEEGEFIVGAARWFGVEKAVIWDAVGFLREHKKILQTSSRYGLYGED